MGNYQVAAEKKVTKAFVVLNQAIAEVEKAQLILKKGVQTDSLKINSLREQIETLKEEITAVSILKEEKGVEIQKNADLLVKLAEFKA